MEGCRPNEVLAMLEGTLESSLAYCGYYKSPSRLRELARELALLAGMAPDHAERVGQAASLCDLGMIGMPHEILGRDGPLSPAERKILQQHTTVGQELLSTVQHPVFQLAAKVAGAHHERMDGGGYPRGIGGAEIPMEARIVAAVSIYVALTQPRPFRKMRTHEEALELLESLGGSHLDERLVRLLLDHEGRFRFRLEPQTSP